MTQDIRELDAIGLDCPLPVLKARKALAAMPPGAQLRVRATDPMAAVDIPHLCHQDGHRLLSQERHAENGLVVLSFLVERGAGRDNDQSPDDGA